PCLSYHFSFSFTAPPTTEIYTLSLHDALPILTGSGFISSGTLAGGISARSSLPVYSRRHGERRVPSPFQPLARVPRKFDGTRRSDRKSTRLNSSHVAISYAVFCLKKKKKELKI